MPDLVRELRRAFFGDRHLARHSASPVARTIFVAIGIRDTVEDADAPGRPGAHDNAWATVHR